MCQTRSKQLEKKALHRGFHLFSSVSSFISVSVLTVIKLLSEFHTGTHLISGVMITQSVVDCGHVKTYLSDDVSLNVSVSAIIVPASLYISESLSRSLALLVPFNTATIK
jgi:hypothetical protein